MAWPTCAPVGWALKDEAKVQGWQKSDSGIVGLWGDKGGYGWIKGDAGRVLVVWRGNKKWIRGENWRELKVREDIKKPRQAWRLAVAE